ncbi:hypothetical protein DSL72_008773 [Monilinia vaccinii-corymbosi]|uniref:F-box domain-containing protein n=1 Tax=Monilinia vaccinii-corymbosi TaxID=61207 RepID=A0A8A3PS24_9HELO|nr:hypothetical protein DSL72_008773 [Monilinia vaccinii-corymbosi]
MASRLPVVVRNLQKLPREIVHQVLNDLPVIKVLSILSWKIVFLDQCVMSHIYYGRIFSSQDGISMALKHYTLYREICWFHRWPPADTGAASNFASSGQSLSMEWGPLDLIIATMRRTIRAGLDIEFYDLDLLGKHARNPRPSTTNMRAEGAEQPLNLHSCWIYWNWIKESKRELNEIKSKQLRSSARLVEKYPRVLKRPLDPSQGAPRPNTTHLVANLEAHAMRSLRDRNLYHHWHNNWCIPGTHMVELVPYDRYLWLLLETLDKHPFEDRANELEDGLAKVSLQNQEQGINPGHIARPPVSGDALNTFQYPEEVADGLETVLRGLMYIYTEPPLVVPRIRWPPETNESSPEKRPKFFVGRRGHENTPQIEHRCVNKHIKPHDQREYEWLAAFLKVVTWIEWNIGPAKEDF